MLSSTASITLAAGLLLIIIALIGGGIEIKEVRIPPLPLVPRGASFLAGCILTCLVFFDHKLFETPLPSQSPPAETKTQDKRDLGTAITNHLIDVHDVKRELHQLGMYNGPINDEADEAYFQAVANFQHTRNITQDGLVGGETYGKLREALPAFFGDPKTEGSSK